MTWLFRVDAVLRCWKVRQPYCRNGRLATARSSERNGLVTPGVGFATLTSTADRAVELVKGDAVAMNGSRWPLSGSNRRCCPVDCPGYLPALSPELSCFIN